MPGCHATARSPFVSAWVSVIAALSLLQTSAAPASTYYLSPAGSDSHSGASPDSPWLRFEHAIPQLAPGDELVLLDGTYTHNTSGMPVIDCTANAAKGTDSDWITLRAQNERRAFIDNGRGVGSAFRMVGCSYWHLEGIRVRGGDNRMSFGHTFAVHKSSHINIRRLLAAGVNTCSNVHVVSISESSYVRVEDSEVYDFHRHGLQGWKSHHLTYRRVYSNGRNGADTCSDLYSSGDRNQGDEAMSFYRCGEGRMENSISENVNQAFTCHSGETQTCSDNEFIGNIALNTFRGLSADSRCRSHNPCTDDYRARRNRWINNVTFNARQRGLWLIGQEEAYVAGNSIISTSSIGIDAEMSAGVADPTLATHVSVAGVNNLVFDMRADSSTALSLVDYHRGNWRLERTNIFGKGTRHDPADFDCPNCFVDSLTVDPQLRDCIVYLPDASPMRGAGVGGADIGANLLFRYHGGVVTNEPLWNSDGSFPCGAIIPGVNDVAGSSCFDVHLRLNVNTPTCPFPDGYLGAPVADGVSPSDGQGGGR